MWRLEILNSSEYTACNQLVDKCHRHGSWELAERAHVAVDTGSITRKVYTNRSFDSPHESILVSEQIRTKLILYTSHIFPFHTHTHTHICALLLEYVRPEVLVAKWPPVRCRSESISKEAVPRKFDLFSFFFTIPLRFHAVKHDRCISADSYRTPAPINFRLTPHRRRRTVLEPAQRHWGWQAWFARAGVCPRVMDGQNGFVPEGPKLSKSD